MSRELLEQARVMASNLDGLSEELVAEYDKFCDTVRSNGLQRLHNKHWQTTFEIPDTTDGMRWQPDSDGGLEIGFAEGNETWWMPKAYLEDPEAWLQGALAAHDKAVADRFVEAAQKRAARKAELRRQLEELEAEE